MARWDRRWLVSRASGRFHRKQSLARARGAIEYDRIVVRHRVQGEILLSDELNQLSFPGATLVAAYHRYFKTRAELRCNALCCCHIWADATEGEVFDLFLEM